MSVINTGPTANSVEQVQSSLGAVQDSIEGVEPIEIDSPEVTLFFTIISPDPEVIRVKNVAIMKELTNPGSQILMDRYMKTSEYLGTTLKELAQARSSASTVIRSPIIKDGSCIQELKDTDRLLSLVFALRILTDDSRRVQVQKWIKFQAPFLLDPMRNK